MLLEYIQAALRRAKYDIFPMMAATMERFANVMVFTRMQRHSKNVGKNSEKCFKNGSCLGFTRTSDCRQLTGLNFL